MKIFDCTTFFKEKMMMDIRFNILNEYVSKFIVVESKFTHSGKKKELNFNKNDFPKFLNNTKFNRCHFGENLIENHFLEAKIIPQKAKPQPKH